MKGACYTDIAVKTFSDLLRSRPFAVAAGQGIVWQRAADRVVSLAACHVLLARNVVEPPPDFLLAGTCSLHSFERLNCMAVCLPKPPRVRELLRRVLVCGASMPGNGRKVDGLD